MVDQDQPQDLQTVLATEQLMPSEVNDSKPAEITPVAETPKTSTRGRGGKLIISYYHKINNLFP